MVNFKLNENVILAKKFSSNGFETINKNEEIVVFKNKFQATSKAKYFTESKSSGNKVVVPSKGNLYKDATNE